MRLSGRKTKMKILRSNLLILEIYNLFDTRKFPTPAQLVGSGKILHLITRIKSPSLPGVSRSSVAEHPKYCSEGRRVVPYREYLEFVLCEYVCVVH